MLEIFVEAKGNTGGKYFPCTGHFGVTPVVASGTINTRVPPFAQPLPVKAVYAIIRCVETRGSKEKVLWEKVKTIWSAPEYTILGTWSHPFRISIPPEVGKIAPSSLHLKEWKAVWKFDLAIEHEPIPYVGHRIMKSFHLDIHNHAHPISPTPPPISVTVGDGSYATVLNVTPPTGAFGPEDTINVAVQAIPCSSQTSAKRAILVFERVMDFLEEERSDTSVIATSSADMKDQDGIYRCCLSIKLPKRTARWDVGETAASRFISMRFQLRTTVAIKSKSTRELSAAPIPVNICGASSAQRAIAAAATPTKVRKHRSSMRGLYMHQGTTEISDIILQRSPSPSRFVNPSPGVKPILLPPHHPAQSQSISFVFPSPPPHASYLGSLPPIENTVPDSVDRSWSMLKSYQQTGRRISTTASEEEAMQPSRTRQRMLELPSLDSLGLGLPHSSRRPVTAPAQMSDARECSQIVPLDTRPTTSAGMHLPILPTFAFQVKED